MPCLKQMTLGCLVIISAAAVVMVAARPDSAGHVPLPGPGLSYGGIPYGSVSGDVAQFFKRQAPSAARVRNLAPPQPIGEVDFAPIEQWL